MAWLETTILDSVFKQGSQLSPDPRQMARSKGSKNSLEGAKGAWIDDLQRVLWRKVSMEHSSLSLVYGSESSNQLKSGYPPLSPWI